MKNIRNIMLIVLSAAVLVSLAFVYACAKAEQDNPYDPKASNFQRVIYVSEKGDDDNDGSKEKPLKTIQAGIQKAWDVYTGKDGKPTAVYVMPGTYTVNWYNDDNRIVMVDGISLYGFGATIVDESDQGGGYGDPNRAIYCGTDINNKTVIDGFIIILGKVGWSAGIYCEGSPTIQKNIIEGRGQTEDPGTSSIGIYNNGNQASPIICDNSIYAKWNNNVSVTDDKSIGIYNTNTSSVIIERNYIDAGEGMNTYGIYDYVCTDTKIWNNVVYGGKGSNISQGIYDRNSSSKIFNNTIHGGTESSSSCIYIRLGTPEIANNILTNNTNGYGIYEYDSSSHPLSVKNNDFYSLIWVYRDGATPSNLSTISDMQTYLDAQGITRGGNINVNPQFDSKGDGWHLGNTSAVSTDGLDGSTLGWGFTTDKDGVGRTGNGSTGWSMGAYEYD